MVICGFLIKIAELREREDIICICSKLDLLNARGLKTICFFCFQLIGIIQCFLCARIGRRGQHQQR